MACRIAFNSTSSPNGLVKNSTAPAFMAWTVMGTSPWPVMKMIGMSVRSAATRFCSSRPLRPGRVTSSTRQLGTRTRGRARNSCADANVSGCQPAHCGSAIPAIRAPRRRRRRRTRLGRREPCETTSRQDPSRRPPHFISLPCISQVQKGGSIAQFTRKAALERAEQSRVAEWLEQALHCALFEHAQANGLISEL